MKLLKKYIFIISATLVCGCNSLDIDPLDVVSDDKIFSSEYGRKTYLAGLYNKLPMEDFQYYHGRGWRHDWNQHEFRSGNHVGETYQPGKLCDVNYESQYWPYQEIREVNHYINYIKNNPGLLSETEQKYALAEAHFIRAFYYFGLVKRYGGVPIITEEQNPMDDIENLRVNRDTEEKVWDFIKSELTLAYDMPEDSEKGKANKYVAAALMSRAMLYAGCIAKYSQDVDFRGEAFDKKLVTVSSDKANEYFKASYDASNMIISSQKYELYEADADKYINYSNLFLNEDSKENIFIRQYSKTAGSDFCFDVQCVPKAICGSDICGSYPTMNTIELFQDIKSIITDENGEPRRFNKLSDVTTSLEPRLHAIVFWPGDTWNDKYFDVYRGLYTDFNGPASAEEIDEQGDRPNAANLKVTNEHQETYEGKNIIGTAGIAINGTSETMTGLYRRKYFNYKASEVRWWSSTQSHIEFRYAEILLNMAEAAFELGIDIDNAKLYIKKIRERAGAVVIPENFIDLKVVREERRRELAFENHIFWDLRRWRIAHTELDRTKVYALYPYYIYDEDKYIFIRQRVIAPSGGYDEYTYNIKYYYDRIPQAQLDANPNLYPNNPEY